MSDLLKTLRARKGLSQAALASKVGTSQPVVAEIESGKRPLSDAMALRLASVLGTDAAVLKAAAKRTAVQTLLSDVAKLDDDAVIELIKAKDGPETLRRALNAMFDLVANDELPAPIKKSARTGLERLSEQTVNALKHHGISIPEEAHRDAFGRARKSAAPITRDMYGRRRRTPEGKAR